MNKINCKEIKQQVLLECKETISKMDSKPHLLTIKCEFPASNFYVKQKEIAITEINASYETYVVPIESNENDLKALIQEANNNPNVTGILLQLPLYDHLKPFEEELINLIDPLKDIDGFVKGQEEIIPCTALGIIELFKLEEYNLEGKNVLLIGRGKTCAQPLMKQLLNKNATLLIAHSKTKNLIELINISDVIISTVGLPNFLNESYFASNTRIKDYLIDVGISKNKDGKITGDFHKDIYKHCKNYTITPGGTGQLTVAYLMKNLIKCKELQNV